MDSDNTDDTDDIAGEFEGTKQTDLLSDVEPMQAAEDKVVLLADDPLGAVHHQLYHIDDVALEDRTALLAAGLDVIVNELDVLAQSIPPATRRGADASER